MSSSIRGNRRDASSGPCAGHNGLGERLGRWYTAATPHSWNRSLIERACSANESEIIGSARSPSARTWLGSQTEESRRRLIVRCARDFLKQFTVFAGFEQSKRRAF